MVATASASNATKVTASTRPTVSGRRAGAHIPPPGPAGVVAALAASVLTRARVEPQPRLASSSSGRDHGMHEAAHSKTAHNLGAPLRNRIVDLLLTI
jgi:hypothetical protein